MVTSETFRTVRQNLPIGALDVALGGAMLALGVVVAAGLTSEPMHAIIAHVSKIPLPVALCFAIAVHLVVLTHEWLASRQHKEPVSGARWRAHVPAFVGVFCVLGFLSLGVLLAV